MISAILSAAILLVQAAPAADGATPPTPSKPATAVSSVTVTSKAKDADDASANQVVCHSEPVIGSLFPKKVCATRRELSERRQQDQQNAQDLQRSAVGGAQPH